LQHGLKDLLELCCSSDLPEELTTSAQRVQVAYEAAQSEGASAFGGVFAVRSTNSSQGPRTVVSKHQRKQAQQIAKAVLLRQRTGSRHNLGVASVTGRQGTDNSEIASRGRSRPPRRTQDNPTPPMEGYGHRGRSGWRVHEKDGDWLWHDTRNLYFHCGKEVLLRRLEGDTFLEISAAPPPRPVLLSFIGGDSGALQRAIFAAWAEHSREQATRGWNTDGSSSSSGDDLESSSDVDASSQSSADSSADKENMPEKDIGLARSGVDAADLFRDIEDFIPAEEAAAYSKLTVFSDRSSSGSKQY
jgi:hypothetical protein